MRPIDANVLEQSMIETIARMMVTRRWMRRDKDNEDEILNVIREAPTIDAVEVVRCKDCRNWGYGVPGESEEAHICVENAEICMPYDGFCHKGKRRDSDG